MVGQYRRIAAVMVVLWLFSVARAQQSSYPNAPAELKQLVNESADQAQINLSRAAQGILRREDAVPAAINSRWQRLVLLTIADAIAPDPQVLQRQTFAAHREMAQTARTDKQVGGSAASSGSTTLVEKTGIPAFIAWAVEHGGVTQSVNGNALTLSGSPYGFAAAAAGDTDKTYNDYALLRRIGFLVTINLTDNQPASLASVKASQVSEFSARFRLFGDRDPRSQRFTALWDRIVGPNLQRKVDLISGVEKELYQNGLRDTGNRVRDKLLQDIAVLSQKDSLTDADLGTLREAILGALHQGIYTETKNGLIDLPPSQKAFLVSQLVSLASVQQLITDSKADLVKQLAAFQKRPQLTFEYTGHPNQLGSDYSELKLLLDGRAGALTLVANAGVSLYHDPSRVLGQSTIRDFGISGSMEGSSRSPFLFNQNNLDPITYSVSGRFERLKDVKDNQGVLQGKISIPVAAAISLPFSVTYATRTDLIKEKEVRGNFGLSFDLEKLFAVKQLDKIISGALAH